MYVGFRQFFISGAFLVAVAASAVTFAQESATPSATSPATPTAEATLPPAETLPSEPVTAHKTPQAQRQIELELEEIEGATAYEIELKSVTTQKVSMFKMKKPLWHAKVKPGKYTMRLRAYDDRGVAGEWAEPQDFLVGFQAPLLLKPAQNAALKTGSEDKSDIEFSWQEVPGAKKYRIDVSDADATTDPAGNGAMLATEVVEATSAKISLPVARTFAWKVTALMPTGEDGESLTEPGRFTSVAKRLSAPPIETPMDRYVQKLNWEKPARTETFTYSLSRFDLATKSWKMVDKKSGVTANEIDVNYNEPGGKYRLQVRAEAKNCEPSPVSKIEFDVFNGNRSPAAVEEARLRDSMEKPTSWYAIASYLITNVAYDGLNADGVATGPQKVTFPGKVGGTGRLGVGYFKPNSNTGYIGIIDLSGLNIAGETVTYASAEIHYAKRYYWGVNQLRVTGGLFYKQIPQTYQYTTGGPFEFKPISFFGPHVGADYWHPFSFKYGMQLNSRLYLATLTGSTPNGQDIISTPSFQFGTMGSMRISNRMIGFAGWAYRLDQIKYKKTDTTTNFDNEVKLTGNYFNIMMEYGF